MVGIEAWMLAVWIVVGYIALILTLFIDGESIFRCISDAHRNGVGTIGISVDLG